MSTFSGESVMERHKRLLEAAEDHVYKETADGVELRAHIFRPQDDPNRLRPCILFFYSSLWDKGLITQFGPQALHFLGRGAMTVLLEYRVSSLHGTGPMEAISDARSAIRWIRYNAEVLKVDTHSVIAAGGSGGGLLALSAAMVPDFADDPSDPNITCVPDALLLYNPITDTTKKGYGMSKFPDPETAALASPSKYVDENHSPMIIFHGSEDRFMPVDQVTRFAKQMRAKQNVCEMFVFEGVDHTFYNFNVSPQGFDATLFEADRFLVEQGFLQPPDEPLERMEW